MAIICPACGEAQPDGARFCNACGSKLPEQTPSAEPEQSTTEQQEDVVVPAEPEQYAPTVQEQSESLTKPAPAKRSIIKPLIIALAACGVLLIAVLASIGPITSNIRYNDIYQRLWGNLLIHQAGDGRATRLTMLFFEDDQTCQVHSYYFFDNRHLTQSLPYTVTDAKKKAADVYIGGQHYTAVSEDQYGITLEDADGNTYTSSAYEVDELISNLRTTLQTQYAEELYTEQKQTMEANYSTAQTAFGNISRWIGYKMTDMIDYIFDPYPTITCEPEEGSTTRFVFTISGMYYINKADLPQVMQHGTMVATYDIDTAELTITEGSDILTAMDVYYLYGLGGAEKEAYRKLYGY